MKFYSAGRANHIWEVCEGLSPRVANDKVLIKSRINQLDLRVLINMACQQTSFARAIGKSVNLNVSCARPVTAVGNGLAIVGSNVKKLVGLFCMPVGWTR